jgi:hypothetical protein
MLEFLNKKDFKNLKNGQEVEKINKIFEEIKEKCLENINLCHQKVLKFWKE